MAKTTAFGTLLNMGVRQTESTPIVGTITGSGNATVTVTFAGMTGSPLGIVVAVLNLDTPDTVATKMAAQMNITANFLAKAVAWSSGPILYMSALLAAANDGTMNIAYTNTTCTGLTPDATSDHIIAGVALTSVVYISKIKGPVLTANTADVTSHDQATSWEEEVVTYLGSGEVGLDIVYDPGAATHAATSGLIAKLKNKTIAQYQVVFPGPYTWTFDGYSIKFEPDEPSDGALTAAVSIKITGQPTLV